MIDKNLDFYDDPEGSVLKNRVPSKESLPEFIKKAERLNDEELNKLPDDVFALVALDGGEKMRKFACVDKGNAALSVIYFLENGHKLPQEAQKTAAANLMTACSWYELAVPVELQKVASGKVMQYIRQAGKKMKSLLTPKDSYVRGGLVQKRASANMEKQALLGAAMGALTVAQGIGQGNKDFKKRQAAMKAGMPASQAFKLKAGELTGSNVMPYGTETEKEARSKNILRELRRLRDLNRASRGMGGNAPTRAHAIMRLNAKDTGTRAARNVATVGAKGVSEESRRKAARNAERMIRHGQGERNISRKALDSVPARVKTSSAMDPYVDITGKSAPRGIEVETGERFALVKEGQARYPIDTASQVQKAFSYFEKYASDFEPHERRMFCLRVHNRAQELGMRSPEVVARYGSSSLSKEAGVQIYRRQRLFRSGTSEHSLLQEMREKCASIRPEVMAVALENFDRETGLDRMWDDAIADPYFSIFGLDKVAEWSFVDGNDMITEERLRKCAETCKEQFEELFGDDMAEEFAKNPMQIFDSLPLDSKRIIMRVGQQVEE